MAADTLHHSIQLHGRSLSCCRERYGWFNPTFAGGHYDGRLCLVGGYGTLLCHYVPLEVGRKTKDSTRQLYIGAYRRQPDMHAHKQRTSIGRSMSCVGILPYVGNIRV